MIISRMILVWPFRNTFEGQDRAVGLLRIMFLTVLIYLFCDWLPPKNCGYECERPPSPEQSVSPVFGDEGNAAAADSIDK